MKFRKIVKSILLPFYRLINLFYLPFLKSYLFSKIEKIPRSTQLFLMTRFDFGTWLLLMHYAECWHKERGPACLVILIPNSHVAVELAKLICPNVELIVLNNRFSRLLFSIFRRDLIQFYTLNPIYAYACCLWPHALYIFDMTFNRKKQENISCYIPAFDPVLAEKWPFSDTFRKTYLIARNGYDYRRAVYQDMLTLFYKINLKKEEKPSPPQEFLKELNITKPYVVINLNCKDYRNKLRNNRRINHPERYNSLIDLLISKGYEVVLQGRDEQPNLPQRTGLIEYFKSPIASIENDYRLFKYSSFAIMPKTGPEVFGPICNTPVLGLNYTELAAIVPKSRCRFFPKHVWDYKKGEFLHWKTLLTRPCFFDVGILSFEEGIEYIELTEEELISAALEFLELLPKPAAEWLNYTPLQKEFKQALHPAHIDLYDVSEAPCDVYLSSQKQK